MKNIELVRELSTVLSNRKLNLKSDSILIFTCGAQPNKKNPTARDIFLQYAKSHLPEYNFFMAEDFFTTSSDDLLSLEEEMAAYSDCIILILESQSTFAELGAFAISDKTVKNCLAINEVKFKNAKSFINEGPIKKINKDSKFGEVIHADLASVSTAFSQLHERLKVIERKRGIRVDFSNYSNFNSSTKKLQLLFLLDLISIFSPIKNTELIKILSEIFGKQSFEINFQKAFLKAVSLIDIQNDYLVTSNKDLKLYFKYEGVNIHRIRSSVVNNYFKYSRGRLNMLKNR